MNIFFDLTDMIIRKYELVKVKSLEFLSLEIHLTKNSTHKLILHNCYEIFA